jgi:hypothetical protein
MNNILLWKYVMQYMNLNELDWLRFGNIYVWKDFVILSELSCLIIMDEGFPN